MFNNRPAMKFVIPFMIGIILGWEYNISFFPVLFFSGFLLIIYFMFRKKIFLVNYSSIIIAIVIIGFGVLKISHDSKIILDDNVSNFIIDGRKMTFFGGVSDLPRVSGQMIRFVIVSDSLRVNGKTYDVSGGVAVSVSRKNVDTTCLKLLSYGKRVILSGELAMIRTARNPGDFDLKNYLKQNDIYASFYPDRLDSGCIGVHREENLLTTFVYPARQSITKKVDELFTGETAQFLKGLLVGERSEIPLEVKTSFINSGVMHILAVSGLHVAIVAFIIIIILQLFRIPEKARIVITCLILIYYNYLTGGAPSVSRSVIMAVVFLGAKLLERKSDMYNTLAISAMILLLIDSRYLFQPGFQLSFAAVFAIVYLYPKIYNLKNFFPEFVKDNRIVIGLLATIAISVAAGVGTLPFSSLYFGKISIISFIANVIIVPLSNVILAIGMVAVAFSYLSSWLANVYAEVTSVLTWLLLKAVDFFGNLSFAYIESRFSVWSSLIFYCWVGIIMQFGKKELRTTAIIASLFFVNIWLYGDIVFNEGNKLLRVTFLDVGQGDAIFIEFPNGNNLLIDGGPKTLNSDAGTKFILPFLKYKGISHIDKLIVTHPDADHLGGVPSLMRTMRIEEILDAGLPCKSALCSEYFFLLDSMKLSRIKLRDGMTLNGSDDSRIYVLNPPSQSSDSCKQKSLNNQSVVLKIVYGTTSIILMGDAEIDAEEKLVSEYREFLKSDILKVAHHGSSSGSSMSFLQLIRPNYAVISVGAKNKFHHPSPEVLDRLQRIESGCYRTDKLGAVIIESDGGKWSVEEWK